MKASLVGLWVVMGALTSADLRADDGPERVSKRELSVDGLKFELHRSSRLVRRNLAVPESDDISRREFTTCSLLLKNDAETGDGRIVWTRTMRWDPDLWRGVKAVEILDVARGERGLYILYVDSGEVRLDIVDLEAEEEPQLVRSMYLVRRSSGIFPTEEGRLLATRNGVVALLDLGGGGELHELWKITDDRAECVWTQRDIR